MLKLKLRAADGQLKQNESNYMKTKTKSLETLYTGKIYADKEVLAAAPFNEVQGTLEFFNLGKYVTDDELEKEYELRGLVPADIYELAIWEEANQNNDYRYLATHWQDAQGKWCYAAFNGWGDGRRVDVRRHDVGWGGLWFFAGVRKGTQSSDTETSALVPLELGRGWKYQLGDNVSQE